jgi:hypothetical protein
MNMRPQKGRHAIIFYRTNTTWNERESEIIILSIKHIKWVQKLKLELICSS